MTAANAAFGNEPDELVALNNSAVNRMFSTFSYPNYRDFRDRNEVFSGLIAYRLAPLSVSHENRMTGCARLSVEFG